MMPSSPLLCHGRCYAGIGSAPLFPSRRGWWHPVYSRVSTVHYIGRLKRREVFEPQASCFSLSVSEHPRLNDLVGLSPVARKFTDWVLNRNFVDLLAREHSYKIKCFLLFYLLFFPPASTASGKVRAWREGDHQVPVLHERDTYLGLEVLSGDLRGEQIA